MAIQIISPTAVFNAANSSRKVSFNSVRTALAFEFMFGGNAKLSARNLVSGGVDAGVNGIPTFAADYMISDTTKRLVTNYVSVADETFVLVTDKLAGTNYAIGTYNSTNNRSLSVSLNQLIITGGGVNAVVQSVSTLSLLVPYFFAARFIGATGNYKAYWGKAGVLNSVTATAGAIPAVLSTAAVNIGSDIANTLSPDARRTWYAAAYSAARSDAEVAQIYTDARARYLASNADF